MLGNWYRDLEVLLERNVTVSMQGVPVFVLVIAGGVIHRLKVNSWVYVR